MKRPEVKRYAIDWELTWHSVDVKIIEVNSKSGMTLAQAKKEVDTIVKFFSKYQGQLRLFPWDELQDYKKFMNFLKKIDDNAKRATVKSIEEEDE